METTRGPEAIEDPPKKRIYDPTVILQWDGSTEEGSALRDPAFLEEFSSFTRVLSEVGIGPVIAWGDIAMMFHGIPICYTVNASANTASHEPDPPHLEISRSHSGFYIRGCA